MTAPSIFISYRIADTLTQAGRLHQSLECYFGVGSTFYDKSSLEPGMKWPKGLEGGVRVAKVVLVLYGTGKDWLGVDDFGRRRIDNSDDWIRHEVETALSGGKLVIPVLFRNTPLPDKDVLPASLRPLLTCQKCDVRESYWDNDLRMLLDAIEKVVSRKTSAIALTLSKEFDPLEGLPLPDPPAYPPPPEPYKGLAWFTEADARIFFGREEEIAELYKAKLEDPFIRTVLFYGASGAGKSSMLHAGLLPRLRRQGWQPVYLRRTLGGSTKEIFEKYLAELKKEKPLRPLFVLDQLEEIYTNPADPGEAEMLSDRIRQLLEASKQVRLLFGFREEYLARISSLMKKGGIPYLEQQLKTMNESGVRRAISAIPSGDLKKYYGNLAFAKGEDDLPERMARDIFSQHEQDIAPLLQFILRSMWDEASKTNKVVFSRTLYERHRRVSMLELLDKQLAELSNDFPVEVGNGLVLDILQHLVTPESTAGAQEEQALLKRYREDVQGEIIPLCQALKDLHLLDVFVDEQQQKHWRLAHDALAPAVLRRFGESDAPGRRARRIIESKDQEKYAGQDAVKIAPPPLSQPDLDIIRDGRNGMPVMSPWTEWLIRHCEEYYEAERNGREEQKKKIVDTHCREARRFILQLQYEDAYIEIAQALRRNALYDEIGTVLMEIAFVQAETGQKDSALECLKRLQEIAPRDWLTEAINRLDEMESEHFRNEMWQTLQKLHVGYCEVLEGRYFPYMRLVEGGAFQMGFKKGIINKGHRVTVDNFHIAHTQVTWWQYHLYCCATGQELPAAPGWGRLGNHPVVNVSWYDAVEYCNWVSERRGYTPVYEIDREQKDPNNKSENSGDTGSSSILVKSHPALH